MAFNKPEKANENNTSIDIIPVELLTNFFSFLTPKEKSKAACVSKQWDEVSSANMLWKPHCEKNYIDVSSKDKKAYKQAYINAVIADRNEEQEKPNVYYFAQTASDIPSDLQKFKLKENTKLYRSKRGCDDALRSMSLFHLGPGDLYFVIYELHITDKQLAAIVFDETKEYRKNTVLRILNKKSPSVDVTAVYYKRPFTEDEYIALEHENNNRCIIA